MLKEFAKGKILKNKEKNTVNNSDKMISSSIAKNKELLKKIFKNSVDLKLYECESTSGLKAMIVYLEELVKKEVLDRDVISPFILNFSKERASRITDFNTLKKIIPVLNIQKMEKLSDIINEIVNGGTIIFFEGIDYAISAPCRGWDKRSIEEPAAEMVVKGPKEGFIESLNVNRSLLRRKIRNPNLVFEEMEIGKQTKTKINIVYVDGIVNKDVLNEVKRRLSKANLDAVLDAGNLEEYLEDSHISPIATVGNSQKPDVVASKILEGRVAIMCDGTPQVMTVPQVFLEAIHSCEDYYSRPYIATILRIIRILSLFISVFLPAFYVALETYHQEMIPTEYLITMIGAEIGTPLPAFLEALLMVLAFGFLKESGTRMPKALGSAISIVGALVIGEAAVAAGIVSSDLIVIIAFTAVASFIVSSLNELTTLYRLVLLILSGIMGLYGITAGLFVMLIHATSLRSFGIPYLTPIAPMNPKGFKDVIIRFPIWSKRKGSTFFSKGYKK